MTKESEMYVHKEIDAGDYVLIKNYTPVGGSSGKRGKREKPTSESRKKLNDKKRAEKIQLLILANFERGYHIILDYPRFEHPQTYEEADRNLTKFLHKMSRKYKKQEKRFKYLATTERGKRKAVLHHHMIVQSMPGILEDITEEWGCHIKYFKMYEEGAYKELAEYFVKAETKEELSAGKSRFHRSRNLITPRERTEKRDGSFNQEPRCPEGYQLIKESLRNGYNERVGVRYQSYLLKKDGPRQQARKGNKNEDQKCTFWESLKKIGSIFSRNKRSRNG